MDSAESHINNMIFNGRNYDLTRVGRYKYNKKLALAERLEGLTLAQNVIAPLTGELLFEAGTRLGAEQAQLIEDNGVSTVYVDVNGTELKVFSNGMVDMSKFGRLRPAGGGDQRKGSPFRAAGDSGDGRKRR